jgi:hypothetical protein
VIMSRQTSLVCCQLSVHGALKITDKEMGPGVHMGLDEMVVHFCFDGVDFRPSFPSPYRSSSSAALYMAEMRQYTIHLVDNSEYTALISRFLVQAFNSPSSLSTIHKAIQAPASIFAGLHTI